jgi:YihY family inner membrane protein
MTSRPQHLGKLDRFQQQHRWLGFPLAVRQKYADDQGGYLAATISYYGFFSFFPLLLVLVTVLGYLLPGHPQWQNAVLGSTLAQLPIIGGEVRQGTLTGSGLALVLGLVISVWSGMGVVLALQNAMNQLWGVPFTRRPRFLGQRLRALALLLVLGGAMLCTTVLAGLAAATSSLGLASKLGSILLSIALNFVFFWVGFRALTAKDVSWRALRGGAIAAAVAYEALQALGGAYVAHVLANATNVYGTFALVIGLLSWIYLAAHITLLAAEANVVAAHRLWPRSFSVGGEAPSTRGDRRALSQRTTVERRRHDQRIEVGFPTDQGNGESG